MLGPDVALIEALEAGKVPRSWRPLGPNTIDEVTILAPLDIVSARGRASKLFEFDYLWEVYKPAEQRRWGYYTLPILYGDRLVGRLDPKFDRESRTLEIRGFWNEDHAPVRRPEYAAALGRGLARFATFLQAQCLDISAVRPQSLRSSVRAFLKRQRDVAVK